MTKLRFAAITLVVLAASAGSAFAQLPRSRGPADPRYYPDLYKGPAWGMTLSEYYTFGSKADGPYGYAIAGHREGSNDDILRWKQATGTALPPGYYLQRWRERRGVQPAAAPATMRPSAQPLSQPPPSQPIAQKKQRSEEVDGQQEFTAEEQAPDAPPSTQSSRRNAQERGLNLENPSQPSKLTGPDQSEVSLLGPNKIRRIRSTDPMPRDDKN